MHVFIVGAGIAGLSCALRLLQQGHRVTVVERQKGPIDRVCGEGILPFGVALIEELGLGSSLRAVGHEFDGIAYYRKQRSISASFGAGRTGIGIERGALDRILRAACLGHAHFALETGVRYRASDDHGADIVLAADGINSSIRRHLGISNRSSRRLGFRLRAAVKPPSRVSVHFFKYGEVYLTPTGRSSLSVAFLLERDKIPVPGAELAPWCHAFFREKFPGYGDIEPYNSAARAPIAATAAGKPPAIHLLGDAYCAFDPISGAGMSFGLLCGKYAAENLHDVSAYYASLKPAIRSVDDFTKAVLLFRGGGWRTRLMLRQLGKAPRAFERILACHNGQDRFWALGGRNLLALLRPW